MSFQYEETLKPSYISVDLSEVELAEYDGPLHPLNNSYLLDVSPIIVIYITYNKLYTPYLTFLSLAEARYDRSEGRRNGLRNQNALR